LSSQARHGRRRSELVQGRPVPSMNKISS
jgi:hypothetical protein